MNINPKNLQMDLGFFVAQNLPLDPCVERLPIWRFLFPLRFPSAEMYRALGMGEDWREDDRA